MQKLIITIYATSKVRATNYLKSLQQSIVRNESLKHQMWTVDKQESQDEQITYDQAHEILDRFEGNAEAYGDGRFVQVSEEDIHILRRALDTL